MADKDAFCYPYHVDDCTSPQENLPNKGPSHSEMLPKNSVSKSHSFMLSFTFRFKAWYLYEFCFNQPRS